MRPKDLFRAAYGLASDASSDESKRIIEAWFRDARPREIASVAAAARTEFCNGIWRRYVPLQAPLDDARLDAFEPSAQLAIAALLSMHRSGYVRELGSTFLTASSDARVVPYLLLRADDIVPKLRAASEYAVAERLRPELALTFARSLGLVELLGARVRGGGGPLVRSIRDFISRTENHDALVEATRDDDPIVRRAAFALRLRTEPPEPVLRAALADADTRIRRFAARTIVSRATLREEKIALLPRIESARSPSLRILALRGWQAVDSSNEHVEAALLDHNAAVRYLAHSILRARQPNRPFGATRLRALAVLEKPEPTVRELVGALGALADVGLRSDVDAVSKLADNRSPRVREEARRTMAWLER